MSDKQRSTLAPYLVSDFINFDKMPKISMVEMTQDEYLQDIINDLRHSLECKDASIESYQFMYDMVDGLHERCASELAELKIKYTALLAEHEELQCKHAHTSIYYTS